MKHITTSTGSIVAANLDHIAARMRAAFADYLLPSPASLPRIVAVSKQHGRDRIVPLLEYGHRLFGENRVQEAQAKWPDLKSDWPDIQLHLIGPLQTNKVKEAAALFDVIETLDREKLAHALQKHMAEQTTMPSLFIQVNTGKEEQKAGVHPELADDFITYCRDDLRLPVVGLMCIPPAEDEPSFHFALLKTIALRHGILNLSMGMSGDFPLAAVMGATHVRVGTAIFGPREQ